MLELDREAYGDAAALGADLVRLGSRFREGSEAPFAQALEVLARHAQGDEKASGDFESALSALRAADAKHRLAFVLTRAAHVDLARGDADKAVARGKEALTVAKALRRHSEVALAHVLLLARIAASAGDQAALRRHLEAIGEEEGEALSARVRQAVEGLRAELGIETRPSPEPQETLVWYG